VVTAASYEARPFGVHSAMPMAEALRRCPHAVVVPGRHERYAEVSADVFAIFHRYTPLVEGLSVDEAFLDVTASGSLFGDGIAIARRIKHEIRTEVGLGASAGVAGCKFAAKIASDLRKPDGLVTVPDDVAGFLAPLPIERMWGVGPQAAVRLHAAGMRTIGDLARAGGARLGELLGSAWGAHVWELARGIDVREVVPNRAAVSMGAEETFDSDLRAQSALEVRLLHQSARVARRLHKSGLAGKVVVVKVKYADFTLKTRRVTLPEPVADTDSIYGAAKALLDRFDLPGCGVRLTGVAVAALTPEPQRNLFPDPVTIRRRRLEGVVSDVADRFGSRSLTRADLLDDEEMG